MASDDPTAVYNKTFIWFDEPLPRDAAGKFKPPKTVDRLLDQLSDVLEALALQGIAVKVKPGTDKQFREWRRTLRRYRRAA